MLSSILNEKKKIKITYLVYIFNILECDYFTQLKGHKWELNKILRHFLEIYDVYCFYKYCNLALY